jgi:hypothetical protein
VAIAAGVLCKLLEDGLVREVQEEVGATPTAFIPIREGCVI